MAWLALVPSAALHANTVKEAYDFNFDGHLDYRMLTLSDGKLSRYDVHIYQPATKRYVKDPTLSGLIDPLPHPKTRRVYSLTRAATNRAVFSGTAYEWRGNSFELVFSVRQEAMPIAGKTHYIFVKARMTEGRPEIFSIQPGDPHWLEQGERAD